MAFAQDRRRDGDASQDSRDIVLSTAKAWGGNQGGAYTCDEWKQYLTRMYNFADGKHRGFIDAKDFETIKRVSPVFAKADFDYFDVAGKGRISRQEFIAQPSPFFARFDKKGSCRVTSDDIKQALVGENSTKTPTFGGGRQRGGMGGAGGIGPMGDGKGVSDGGFGPH